MVHESGGWPQQDNQVGTGSGQICIIMLHVSNLHTFLPFTEICGECIDCNF